MARKETTMKETKQAAGPNHTGPKDPVIIDFTKKIHEQITRGNWCRWDGPTKKYITRPEISTCGREDGEMCVLEWIIARYGNDNCEKIQTLFTAQIDPKCETQVSIWNDHPERTFEEVLAIFKAIDA